MFSNRAYCLAGRPQRRSRRQSAAGEPHAVNFDALPLPDISFEVRVPLCLPLFKPGQALAKARSVTSAVDPDGEAIVSSHGSAPFRRYPKLAVRGIGGDVRFS